MGERIELSVKMVDLARGIEHATGGSQTTDQVACIFHKPHPRATTLTIHRADTQKPELHGVPSHVRGLPATGYGFGDTAQDSLELPHLTWLGMSRAGRGEGLMGPSNGLCCGMAPANAREPENKRLVSKMEGCGTE